MEGGWEGEAREEGERGEKGEREREARRSLVLVLELSYQYAGDVCEGYPLCVPRENEGIGHSDERRILSSTSFELTSNTPLPSQFRPSPRSQADSLL